jgi:alkylation response protein AidB-like acyl-CoA dehydrogenase
VARPVSSSPRHRDRLGRDAQVLRRPAGRSRHGAADGGRFRDRHRRQGGTESSIAKTFVAEAVNRVVDRAVQICGALGISDDVLLSRYYREVRPFRIYDGPSEVHRWAIARKAIGRRRREIEAGDRPRWAGSDWSPA